MLISATKNLQTCVFFSFLPVDSSFSVNLLIRIIGKNELVSGTVWCSKAVVAEKCFALLRHLKFPSGSLTASARRHIRAVSILSVKLRKNRVVERHLLATLVRSLIPCLYQVRSGA